MTHLQEAISLLTECQINVDDNGLLRRITKFLMRVEDERHSHQGDSSNQQAANPMIKAALDAGDDATGLCTIRECVAMAKDKGHTEFELTFEQHGEKVNVMVRILVLPQPDFKVMS